MVRIKILIVEDERIVAEDMKETLQRFGYEVPAIAMTGESAIEKTRTFRPDLILMDIFLAGKMTGIEAAEQIRLQFATPVIYLTGYADEQIMEKAKITEPYGYIRKPYDERELHTAIEIALYRNEMHKKLVESEARYRGFVQTFLGIAFRLQDDFLPVFYHGAVEKITGYSEKELRAGTPSWNDIVHPDDLPAYASKNEEIRSVSPCSTEREYRIIRKDGETRWIYELIQHNPGIIGGGPFIQGTLYDISERKWAEEALLAYMTEMAMRIKQPVEIIRDNLKELVKLISEGKLTPEEISIVLVGQVRNATQVVANVQEFHKAIAEKNTEIPKAYRKFLEAD